MNNRDLINKMLGNRWQASHAPAAGSTVVANVAAPDPQARHHLEMLWYSIRNFVGAGGAAATVQVAVRAASIAGTILAQVDHLIDASSTVNVIATNMGIAAPRGTSLHVTMSTVVGSLTQSVSIAGWTEE